MCGIIGYVGNQESVEVLLGGLKRLEYRGYDSAGIAILTADKGLTLVKKSGKLAALVEELQHHKDLTGSTGIGHTRWATHGAPSDVNAHPHAGDNGKLALIHNGIIENFAALKKQLLAIGETFESETDTEVVAKLVGIEYQKDHNLTEALRRTVNQLEGAFTLLVTHEERPSCVVGARRNSPLVVGLGEGEHFLASDVAAFVQYTNRAISIGQDQIVTITPTSVEITDFFANPVEVEPFQIEWDVTAAEKGGWSSFMAKEIAEEPDAIRNTLRGRITDSLVHMPELDELPDGFFKSINRITIVACGTAAYAGSIASYALEKWIRIPVSVELSHEFRHRDPAIDEKTLILVMSQSGETMDTIMALEYARERGCTILSVCNTQGATIARESDVTLYTHAGPEVAVASTKSLICQVVVLYLFALHVSKLRGSLAQLEHRKTVVELEALPDKVTTVLGAHEILSKLATWMADVRTVLFLGRHVGYPVVLEGALKLKELAYIHAEGFAAGELKHGPIALVEPGQIIFVIVPSPRCSRELHKKIISNIQETRARGARIIAIAEAGDAAVLPYADQVIPVPVADIFCQPILAVIPLQIFALELAVAKGLDVDQPRNLAKSVTVE